MHPILLRFELGGTEVAVGAYSTFMVLAWLAAVVVGTAMAARLGIPARRALFVYLAALLAAVAGGRVMHVLIVATASVDDGVRLWTPTFQGFSLYGALLLGPVTALLAARLTRVPLWRLGDSAVPALAVGIALMRVGCFLRGCCYGLPTDAPWGVTFPAGSPAWAQQMVSGATGILGGMMGEVLPVHPTQLYEMAAALALGALGLWIVYRTSLPDGSAFLICSALFTVFRFADSFLRPTGANAAVTAVFYPLLYAGIVVLLAVLLAMRLRARPRA